MRLSTVLVLALAFASRALAQSPPQGTHAHYAVLTAEWDTAANFQAVDLVYGPSERVGDALYTWWQLEARAENKPDAPALFTLRVLSSRDPLAASTDPLLIHRYQLRLPTESVPLEYRNRHTQSALLPCWQDFVGHFIPSPARGTHRQNQIPETASYLGHTLTLQWTGKQVPWPAWNDVRILTLDPELLVGTGRNFRDAQLKRLPQQPQKQNYTYVPFKEEEYPVMIDAGINLFTISPEQMPHVSDQPVFFIRPPDGKLPLSWPGDFYRSNYLGPVMFMDEPAVLLVADKQVHNTLRHFSDATHLLMQRVRSRYNSGTHYSALFLDRSLRRAGVNLGEMTLVQHDFPAWETLYSTAHYQLAAGLAGIVHEGRYRLDEFDRQVARWTDKPRKHTTEEMLRYHYAFLRGAARANAKHWGMSIYGQADPAISPQAISLAYDLGARYVWFWTSDHGHHVPWPEQLALARHLKDHAAKNPRPSIMHTPPKQLDVAIVIPHGYFLELGDLWWVRALDKEAKSDASQRYARLMRRAHAAIHQAMDRREDFDIVIDEGRPIEGYKRIVRISSEPEDGGRP